MTRQTTPDYTSICPVCKKEITLIRRAGWFRRHMQAKGQICPGSWHTPAEINERAECAEIHELAVNATNRVTDLEEGPLWPHQP